MDDFDDIVRRLRALPRRERVLVAELAGVALSTAQAVALGYTASPGIGTMRRLRDGLNRYERRKPAGGKKRVGVHAE
jgi:hypothetical protein